VLGEIDEGPAPMGTEPGIALGIVDDDDGGGCCEPAGRLIAGSVVLGSDDGEIPPGDTMLGTDCGDCSPPRLPGLGAEPGDCGPPGLPREGTLCSCGGRPVCARTGVAGMIRTKAASVHTYFMGLHIRNRGATIHG
jgi:hypothetical protein